MSLLKLYNFYMHTYICTYYVYYILGLKDQIRKVCAEEYLVCGEGDEQGGAWQEKVVYFQHRNYFKRQIIFGINAPIVFISTNLYTTSYKILIFTFLYNNA